MRFYFLRHGIADWPDWDPAADDERPLTQRGVRRMRRAAKVLCKRGIVPEIILSSPLTRARQTAEIVAVRFGRKVNSEALLAPGFGVAELRKLANRHKGASSVMLVGHEPDFSRVASEIAGGGHLALKKGGLACVRVKSASRLQGELELLLTPKLMRSG